MSNIAMPHDVADFTATENELFEACKEVAGLERQEQRTKEKADAARAKADELLAPFAGKTDNPRIRAVVMSAFMQTYTPQRSIARCLEVIELHATRKSSRCQPNEVKDYTAAKRAYSRRRKAAGVLSKSKNAGNTSAAGEDKPKVETGPTQPTGEEKKAGTYVEGLPEEYRIPAVPTFPDAQTGTEYVEAALAVLVEAADKKSAKVMPGVVRNALRKANADVAKAIADWRKAKEQPSQKEKAEKKA